MGEKTPEEHAHAMSNTIAIIGEAQFDVDVATMLIDQTLLRTVNWISESDIDSHRTFVGRDDAESFVKWQRIEVDRGKDYRRAIRRTSGFKAEKALSPGRKLLAGESASVRLKAGRTSGRAFLI